MSEKVQPYGLTPRQIVSTYSEEDWEELVNEWMTSLKPPYVEVHRFSGAGDKGRDVVGFYGPANTACAWDNYQCKHKDRPLMPSEIWIELGKLCYYTFRGDYSIPGKYRFVAPREVGPSLKDLLFKPLELRRQLLSNWEVYCADSITDTADVPLSGAFRAYVERFDFSIVGYTPLLDILEQHRTTHYSVTRFKIAPPPRPDAPAPPGEPAPFEATYVQCLLAAYGDADGIVISNLAELATALKYSSHFNRSREWFYKAEWLNRFSRDHYPPGAFHTLKQQVFDGIIDTVEKVHSNGFERVSATTDVAAALVLGNSDLAPHTEVGDKKGICHHLANDEKITWVKK